MSQCLCFERPLENRFYEENCDSFLLVAWPPVKITIALSKIGLDVVSNGDVIATNKLVRYEDL